MHQRTRIVAALLAVACSFTLAACRKPEQKPAEGPKKPVSAPTAPAESLDREQFMTGCLNSCKDKNKGSQDFSKFCHQYCDCSFMELEAKIPFAELKAFTSNQPTESAQAIQDILHQCGVSARESINSN